MAEKFEMPEGMICQKCNEPMVLKRTGFTYIGRTFHTEVLQCPTCGLVFVPQDLVKGRMKEVESLMEDK